MDIHTPEQRRFNMRSIRARDTKPEMTIRRSLHAHGYRYRLHSRKLPGCPDLVLTKYQAVIFVHGCFWHGHDCPMFRLPATRTEFWKAKINANRLRDDAAASAIADLGWRRLTIWECALRGAARLTPDAILGQCESFLKTSQRQEEISGNWPKMERT